VQQVELGDAQLDGQLHDLVQHAHVLLVDDHVHRADDPRIARRAL